MKRFSIGDIQGNYKGLMQCLERSEFNYEVDELIVLGDVCDGLPETKECFDELLKIKNLVLILGNHDKWLLDWMNDNSCKPDIWVTQGGRNTLRSYGNDNSNVPASHKDLLLNKSKLYHTDGENRLFVHGGIDQNKKMENQSIQMMMWDRELVRLARQKHYQKTSFKFAGFKEIYVGHTSTTYFSKSTEPQKYCNVRMLDTGGGWEGKITIMEIRTGGYWQSDLTPELYPGVMPRG